MKHPANLKHELQFDITAPLPLLVFLVLVLALLSGCGSSPNKPHPQYAPTAALPELPAKPMDGRIYQAERYVSLFQDVKAHRTGDILTVDLTENTSGQKSADTTVNKSNSNSISAPVLGVKTYPEGAASLASEHEFAGDGASNQSNRLSGTIAVMVMQVLPGGNLVVQGEKWISINQGDEYVRLRGIVRPQDISASNTVASTKIADARISYGAIGAVAQANSMGWLSRFFISPVWPF